MEDFSSYYERLFEEADSLYLYNPNLPPNLKEYIKHYYKVIDGRSRDWLFSHWDLFCRKANEASKARLAYNYLQTYFWSILVNIITFFVDFDSPKSIERFANAGIFNALQVEKYIDDPRHSLKFLVQVGDGLIPYHDKGEAIIRFIRTSLKDILTFAIKGAEGDKAVADFKQKKDSYRQFYRTIMTNVIESDLIRQLRIEPNTIIDNLESYETMAYEIWEDFYKQVKSLKASSEEEYNFIIELSQLFSDEINVDFNKINWSDRIQLLNNTIRSMKDEYERLKKESKELNDIVKGQTGLINSIRRVLQYDKMDDELNLGLVEYLEKVLKAKDSVEDRFKEEKQQMETKYKERDEEILNLIQQKTPKRSVEDDNDVDMDKPLNQQDVPILDLKPAIDNAITIMTREIAALQAQIESYKKENISLHEELQTLKSNMSQEQTNSDQRISELEAALSENKRELADKESFITKLQKEQSALSLRQNELVATRDKLNQELEIIKKEREDALEYYNRFISEGQGEYDKLKKEKEDYINGLSREKREFETAKEELTEAYNKELISLRAHISQLEAKLQANESTMSEYDQKSIDQENKWIQQLDQLKREYAEKESVYSQQISDLQARNQRLDDTIKSLNSDIINKDALLDQLRKEIAEKESIITEYEKKIELISNQLKGLESTISSLRAENAKLENRMAELTESNDRLMEEMAKLNYEARTSLANAAEQVVRKEIEGRNAAEQVKKQADQYVDNLNEQHAQEIRQKNISIQEEQGKVEQVRQGANEYIANLNEEHAAEIKQKDAEIERLNQQLVLFNPDPLGPRKRRRVETEEEDTKKEDMNIFEKTIKGIFLLYKDPPKLFTIGDTKEGEIYNEFIFNFSQFIPELSDRKEDELTTAFFIDILKKHWGISIKEDDPDAKIKILWTMYRSVITLYEMISVTQNHIVPDYISIRNFILLQYLYEYLMKNINLIGIGGTMNMGFCIYMYTSGLKNAFRFGLLSQLSQDVYNNYFAYRRDKKHPRPSTWQPRNYWMQEYDAHKQVFLAKHLKTIDIDDDKVKQMNLQRLDPKYRENYDIILREFMIDLDQGDIAKKDPGYVILAAGIISNQKKTDIQHTLQKLLSRPLIGKNNQDLVVYRIKPYHKSTSMNHISEYVYIAMNKRTQNYRVVLIDKNNNFAIAYPGNSMTNPLMPYKLYFNPLNRKELIFAEYNDHVPSSYIRLDNRYTEGDKYDRDELLNALFPKTGMENITIREMLERIIPDQHILVNGVGSGVITSRQLVGGFITPID